MCIKCVYEFLYIFVLSECVYNEVIFVSLYGDVDILENFCFLEVRVYLWVYIYVYMFFKDIENILKF